VVEGRKWVACEEVQVAMMNPRVVTNDFGARGEELMLAWHERDAMWEKTKDVKDDAAFVVGGVVEVDVELGDVDER